MSEIITEQAFLGALNENGVEMSEDAMKGMWLVFSALYNNSIAETEEKKVETAAEGALSSLSDDLKEKVKKSLLGLS